jgi:hypothetical protein
MKLVCTTGLNWFHDDDDEWVNGMPDDTIKQFKKTS